MLALFGVPDGVLRYRSSLSSGSCCCHVRSVTLWVSVFDWTHWLCLVRVQFLSGLCDCCMCPGGQPSTASEGNPSMHCHKLVVKCIKDRVWVEKWQLQLQSKPKCINLIWNELFEWCIFVGQSWSLISRTKCVFSEGVF